MLILATWPQTSYSCFPLFDVDHLKIANCSNLTIVFYPLGNFGQALCRRSCHEDLILTRKGYSCTGIAFIQGDSAGGSKLIEQTLMAGGIFDNSWQAKCTLSNCQYSRGSQIKKKTLFYLTYCFIYYFPKNWMSQFLIDTRPSKGRGAGGGGVSKPSKGFCNNFWTKNDIEMKFWLIVNK